MEPYFRLIQSRLHPTPSGKIPIWVVYLIPHYRGNLQPAPASSLPSPPSQEIKAALHAAQNSETKCGMGRGRWSPTCGGKRGGQAGAGGARLPGGAGPWVRSLTGERALGLGRRVTHLTLGPGTFLPPTPHRAPTTHCALVMSMTPRPRSPLDPLPAWGASNGSICPHYSQPSRLRRAR